MVLRGAAHNEQVTGGENDAMAALAVISPAGMGAQAEGAGPSQADDGNEGVDLGSAYPISVPRHTVLASLVIVAEQSLEGHRIVSRKGRANVVDHVGHGTA